MGTISKALDLLGHFSSTRSQIGLTEFVTLTRRDKATVHRHLSELEQNGFLEQHPQTRAYRLGPALLRLAAVREAAFPMRAAAPHRQGLVRCRWRTGPCLAFAGRQAVAGGA